MDSHSATQRHFRKLAETSSCYLILCLPGIVGLYAKFSILKSNWLGIVRILPEGQSLSAQVAGFFLNDISINFLIVPALLVSALLLIKRGRRTVALIAALLLALFYFTQLQAQDNLGQYMSWQMLYEASQFFVADPLQASEYIHRSAIIKFCLFIGVSVVFSITCRRIENSSYYKLPIAMAGITLAAGVIATLISTQINNRGLARSSAGQMFSNSIPLHAERPGSRDLHQSLEEFRALSHTKKPEASDVFFGRETGSNILFFVLETGPASLFKDGAQAFFPEHLRNRLLVSNDHYTTYPYTSDAVFSIFSGLYPEGRRSLIEHEKAGAGVGLFRKLADSGYHTATFSPLIYNGDVDEGMFTQMGFLENFIAIKNVGNGTYDRAVTEATSILDNALTTSPHFRPGKKQEVLDRLLNDVHALNELEQRILASKDQKTSFAFAFFPQIGHAPWPELGPGTSVESRGHVVVEIQRRWLQRIIDTLDSADLLDNTIIVMTADHGVRTKVEDPAFQAGTISSYSFQVPLAIYAPKAFASMALTNQATSHIDIAPSLAVLMGCQECLNTNQGMTLWADKEDRILFFLANAYGGADGYRKSIYYMQNDVTGAQGKSLAMDFSDRSSQALSQDESEAVTKTLKNFHYAHNEIVRNINGN